MSKPMSKQIQKVADRYEKATGKRFDAKTNAQHIRSMTDEELAIMFAMLRADLTRLDRPVRPYQGRDVNDNYDWLKQPYKEDAGDLEAD